MSQARFFEGSHFVVFDTVSFDNVLAETFNPDVDGNGLPDASETHFFGHAGALTSTKGTSNQNTDPPLSGNSAPAAPPCASAKALTMESPSPVLVSLPVGLLEILANSTKSCERSSSGMPGPSSRTSTRQAFFEDRATTRVCLLGGLYLSALER